MYEDETEYEFEQRREWELEAQKEYELEWEIEQELIKEAILGEMRLEELFELEE